MPHVGPRRPFGLTWLDLAALAAVAVLGLLDLHQPFTWDQAMFTVGARQLDAGAAPYVDVWDTKQPGIFAFYWIAGRLFGFSEAGIHLFELLYMLAFSLALIMMLRRSFEHRWVVSLVPVLVAGHYFAIAQDWHLTQVESLVPFPLFLAMIWGWRAATEPRRRGLHAFLAGVAGGVVLLFKLALLPVLAAFWFVEFVQLLRGSRTGRAAAAVAMVAALAAGLATSILPVLGWIAARGALSVALWTWFEFPVRILANVQGLRVRRLLDGFAWFLHGWGPLLALAVVPVWEVARKRRNGLTVHLLAWIAAALAAILIQRFSYWQYHFVLLGAPVGILAAMAIDRLWPRLRDFSPGAGRAETAFMLALVFAVLCAHALELAAAKAATLARDGFGFDAASRARHHERWSRGGGYARFTNEAELVSGPEATLGPIVVIGHPLVYWLARRDVAAPRVITDFLTLYTEQEWRDIARRVSRGRAPYVYVSDEDGTAVERSRPRSDPWLAMLAAEYHFVRKTKRGAWYERNAAGPVP